MKKNLLFIFFTLSITSIINTDNIAKSNNNIEVLLSGPKEVYINDKLEIELSIKTQGNITIEPSITLIGVNQFQEIGNTVQSQTEIINGNIMQVQYLKKILKPTQVGTFTIGPSILKTNMGEIKSNIITVEVFDRSRNLSLTNTGNDIINYIESNINITKISIIILSIILILSLYFLIKLENKENKNTKNHNNVNKKQILNKKEIIISTNEKTNTQNEKNRIDNAKKNIYDVEIEKLYKKIIENHNINISSNEINNFNTIIKKLIEKNIDQDLIEQYKKEYNNIQKNKWGIKI